MVQMNKLDYAIIDETKCGIEELSVLIGGFAQEYGLENLIGSLVRLVNSGLISCYLGDTLREIITGDELEEYINKRKLANENLDEYPDVCEEYSFVATDKGIEQLSDDDKPIVS
jgi:hypothetical protein